MMSSTLYVGDVHGESGKLVKLVQYALKKGLPFDRVCQVGDFGVSPHEWPLLMPLTYIDGNHDNYDSLEAVHPSNVSYKRRGLVEDGVMYIGGAYSIDGSSRISGLDWFPDKEQISMREFVDIYRYDRAVKAIIAHDTIPAGYVELGINGVEKGNYHSDALGLIYGGIRPSLWVHGHHHKPLRYTVGRCKFYSLDTLSHYSTNRLEAMLLNCTVIL